MITGSNMDHVVANIRACEEGPLEQSERGEGGRRGKHHLYYLRSAGVVDAFDKAWRLDKANCPLYYWLL